MSGYVKVNNEKKRISNIFANINNEKKKIVSGWANVDGVKTKIYSSSAKRYGWLWGTNTVGNTKYLTYKITAGKNMFSNLDGAINIQPSSKSESFIGNAGESACYHKGYFYVALRSGLYRSNDLVNWSKYIDSSVLFVIAIFSTGEDLYVKVSQNIYKIVNDTPMKIEIPKGPLGYKLNVSVIKANKNNNSLIFSCYESKNSTYYWYLYELNSDGSFTKRIDLSDDCRIFDYDYETKACYFVSTVATIRHLKRLKDDSVVLEGIIDLAAKQQVEKIICLNSKILIYSYYGIGQSAGLLEAYKISYNNIERIDVPSSMKNNTSIITTAGKYVMLSGNKKFDTETNEFLDSVIPSDGTTEVVFGELLS